jgi:pimeloyl-ACP methyl ester carboxylesterase
MSKARLNGIEINFRQVGEGDDVVFIHGLAANHAFWRFQLLMALARDYRVTTYDLRGHGYSQMTPTGYTSADMVGDLLALLDHAGVQRAHLVGHSFGGVVALHCAVLHPERVASLTIQDSRVRALQPTQRLIDWPEWEKAKANLADHGIEIDENEEEVGIRLLEKLAALDWRADRERSHAKPLFVPFQGWASGNRSAARWLKLLDTTAARQEIQQMAGLDRDALATITQPALAIYGEHSRCLRTYESLPEVLRNLRRHILINVGHFDPVTKPVEVADLLLEFLRSLGNTHATTPGNGHAKDFHLSEPIEPMALAESTPDERLVLKERR